MGEPTAEQIAQRAFDLGVLDERQLEKVWSGLGTKDVALQDMTQLLLRGEYLTNYQVDRLVKGDKTGFFFGDYKVLYYMGAGSFARVYRAVHKETKQVVALKVLRHRFSEDPIRASQFVREGELGRTLRHPNIVPVHEVYSVGTTHFLVMEFVEGRNLREFVRIRGKIDPAEATRLMMDIAAALKYAFEHGLTHRDVKMSNVLVSSHGQAKLADFGLAAVDDELLDDLGTEFPNPRTIDYAALERGTGVRKDDTRTDIYFLGCIYYNMVAGKPPLSDTKDRVKRLSRQRFLDVVSIRECEPGVPSAVAYVVNKSMMLDVNRRYQTPGEMLAELELVARRLASDTSNATETSEQKQQRERLAKRVLDAGSQGTVMVVESNTRMQDIFRDGLKKAGYRVLLTSDPQRALERLGEPNARTDCLVLNAQELGKAALKAFNQMCDDKRIQFLPAILLLDVKQKLWKEHARKADHRLVLSMPITMKQLREHLTQLIPSG